MENLGSLADITNGAVDIVDPLVTISKIITRITISRMLPIALWLLLTSLLLQLKWYVRCLPLECR